MEVRGIPEPVGWKDPLTGLEGPDAWRRTLDWFKTAMERFREEIRTFANSQTLFMGLVNDKGGLEFYDGKLRFLDAGGHVVQDGIAGDDYAKAIRTTVDQVVKQFPKAKR